MAILNLSSVNKPLHTKRFVETTPDIKILTSQNDEKISPFAPEFKCLIAETKIIDVDFDKVEKFLLDKEEDILKLPYRTYIDKKTGEEVMSDGFTGLGNSTTARFGNYNVLQFEDPIFKKIKKNILNAHDKLMEKINVEKPNTLYVQCWYNVLRKGQQIKTHLHDDSNLSYLGGHIIVSANDTYTAYITSYQQLNNPDVLKIKNKKGDLTFFTSSTPHFTNQNSDDNLRITIAFDLFLNKRDDHCIRLY